MTDVGKLLTAIFLLSTDDGKLLTAIFWLWSPLLNPLTPAHFTGFPQERHIISQEYERLRILYKTNKTMIKSSTAHETWNPLPNIHHRRARRTQILIPICRHFVRSYSSVLQSERTVYTYRVDWPHTDLKPWYFRVLRHFVISKRTVVTRSL